MRRPRLRPPVVLLSLAALLAAGVSLAATAGDPGPRAPDLRADPATGLTTPQVYVSSGPGAGRLLVRFDGYVTNVGDGPLEVAGDPQVPGGVRQLAWAAAQGPGDVPGEVVGPATVAWQPADGHQHWHLERAMRYALWTADRSREVAPGQKVGFCLEDLQRGAPAPSPTADPQAYMQSVTRFCESTAAGGAGRAATALRMGLSSGWRDVYGAFLPFQWVDVSDVAPGVYRVATEADPDGVVWEGGGAAEVNPRAFSAGTVTIPGWIAAPLAADQTGAPLDLTLGADRVGSPSAVRYRITQTPAHGTLDVPAGTPLSSPAVRYTPDEGYRGPDGFRYVASAVGSPFPLTPPQAAVALSGPAPSLAISGAPASVVAGTSVRLSAALTNVGGPVSWSSDAGSVSGDGTFTAPAAPPPGGVATIRATSRQDPALHADVRIAVTPAPRPEPRPGVEGAPRAGTRLLSGLAVRGIGGRTVVAAVTTGRRAGALRVTLTFAGRIVGRCVAPRVPARRTATCRMTMRRAYPLARVRVTARFTTGGAVAVRRAPVVPPTSS